MKLSLIIIVICSLFISAINIFLANMYARRERSIELKNISNQVNVLTAQYTQRYNLESSYFFQFSLDNLANEADGTIIVTDINGNVFASSTTETEIPKTIDISYYDEVIKGASISYTGGFSKIFGYNTFSFATPFTYNKTVKGIIFIVTKSTLLSPQTMATASMTMFSVAIAVVVALIISYFLSRRLIRPLKKIGVAAKEISLGRYTTIDTNTKIDEYNEMISSFNMMSRELEQQDKARSEFIANVSHDLRTPLTTIMGFVRGIMDGTIPPEMQNQYLGVTLSEAERMRDMVNNNLDLSKYESGNIKLSMSTFNLNEIVRSIVVSMEKRIREKGITIQFKYERTENFVEADESAIYRVIQNLLDNALKFAAKETEIEISITRKNKLVLCRIKNYGSTISPEEQLHIWDRYYKADESRGFDKRGSGLGLFIVKSIINQHNQQIYIDSDENSVAFEFTLNEGES